MCGGIGSRINLSFKISEKKIEKPLILLNNKPLIEHIIGTILNSKKQFRIFAAVSSNTKETEVFINDKYSDKIKVLKTSGRGYSEDFTNIIIKIVIAVAIVNFLFDFIFFVNCELYPSHAESQ